MVASQICCRREAFCFRAEDGIRSGHVTGVQTCALPISESPGPALPEDPVVPGPGGLACAVAPQEIEVLVELEDGREDQEPLLRIALHLVPHASVGREAPVALG